MNRHRPRIRSVAAHLGIITAVAVAAPAEAGLIGEWTFDNAANLVEATTGNDLIPVGVIDAAPAGIAPGDGAAAVDLGEYLGLDHTAGANGGGEFTNEYAILFDISYPATSVGSWMSFFQTNDGNANDGDLFVRDSDGAVGVGTYSVNTTVADTWYRVIVSHDLGDGPSRVFVNGELWTDFGTQALDGRFSLYHDRSPDVLLFADDTGDDATIYVSNVAFFDTPLDAAGALALGNAGDPIVEPTKFCPVGLSCTTGSDPVSVTLDWTAAIGLDSTGVEILRDGGLIATLPPDADSYIDMPPLPGGPYVDLEYTLRMTGGADSGNCPELSSTATFYTGALVDDLVVHLELEVDGMDSSGRDNHGTLSGAPPFVAGQIGQAFELKGAITPHQYLSLGTPTDLAFGTNVDFTVSVWVNNLGGFGLDNPDVGASLEEPAIASNKDWNLGGNIGWVIAGGNADGRWEWNIGDGVARADYDGPANEINDGQWHHLVVSHDRDGEAVFYYDGQRVAARDISFIGNIDSALPTVVGTDGAEASVWAAWFTGKIDDLLIWRRVVTETEVRTVHEEGLAGRTFGQGPLQITSITYDEILGEVTIVFNGRSGRTYGVDTATDLTDWGEVGDVVGEAGSTTVVVDIDPAPPLLYFRIRAIE